MQRSPVFIFRNDRQARDFQLWIKDNFEAIKAKAETSTSVGKLHDIESYHAHSMVFTAIISSHQSKQPDSTPTTCPRAIPARWILALEATPMPKPGRRYGDAARGSARSRNSAPQMITSQS